MEGNLIYVVLKLKHSKIEAPTVYSKFNHLNSYLESETIALY